VSTTGQRPLSARSATGECARSTPRGLRPARLSPPATIWSCLRRQAARQEAEGEHSPAWQGVSTAESVDHRDPRRTRRSRRNGAERVHRAAGARTARACSSA
jgi:hypothetical protein